MRRLPCSCARPDRRRSGGWQQGVDVDVGPSDPRSTRRKIWSLVRWRATRMGNTAMLGFPTSLGNLLGAAALRLCARGIFPDINRLSIHSGGAILPKGYRNAFQKNDRIIQQRHVSRSSSVCSPARRSSKKIARPGSSRVPYSFEQRRGYTPAAGALPRSRANSDAGRGYTRANIGIIPLRICKKSE
jgi:hypothetical protein